MRVPAYATAIAPTLFGVVFGLAWGIGTRVYLGEVGAESDPLLRWLVWHPWWAFGLGFALGALGASFEARHLRRHEQYFVRRQLASPAERRQSQFSALNLLAWTPTLVALALACAVVYALRWAIPMAAFGALTATAITYPIERRIHRRLSEIADASTE